MNGWFVKHEMLKFIVTSLFLCGVTLTVSADEAVEGAQFEQDQISNSEPLDLAKCTTLEKGPLQCVVYPNYIVWMDEGLEADDGSFDIDPLDKQQLSCDQLRVICDRGPQSGRSYAGYFFGIWGKYALGEGGSTSAVRGIAVYDVETGESVFGSEYEAHDPVEFVGTDFITFWRGWYEDTPTQCSDPWARAAYQITFNLKTGEATKGTEVRCNLGE